MTRFGCGVVVTCFLYLMGNFLRGILGRETLAITILAIDCYGFEGVGVWFWEGRMVGVGGHTERCVKVLSTITICCVVRRNTRFVYTLVVNMFGRVGFVKLNVRVSIRGASVARLRVNIFYLIKTVSALIIKCTLIVFYNGVYGIRGGLFGTIVCCVAVTLLLLSPICLDILYNFFNKKSVGNVTLLVPRLCTEVNFKVLLVVGKLLF